MQRSGLAADDDGKRIAALEVQGLRGAAAQEDAVGMKQLEDARADIADDGRLQRGGTERIET